MIFKHLKQQRQDGIALVTVLIVLVVLTLIGISAMRSSLLQERMAGYSRDNELAFQAAEAALREGEAFLSQAVLPNFDGTNGLYQAADPGDAPVYETVDWSADSRVFGGTLDGVSQSPRYIIEELPVPAAAPGSLAADEAVGDTGIYRVTARATGGSDAAIVILQTTFRR